MSQRKDDRSDCFAVCSLALGIYMKPSQIMYERGRYWVARNAKGHYEVYRTGITASERVAYVGYVGEKGVNRAVAECDRRARAEVNTQNAT